MVSAARVKSFFNRSRVRCGKASRVADSGSSRAMKRSSSASVVIFLGTR